MKTAAADVVPSEVMVGSPQVGCGAGAELDAGENCCCWNVVPSEVMVGSLQVWWRWRWMRCGAGAELS